MKLEEKLAQLEPKKALLISIGLAFIYYLAVFGSDSLKAQQASLKVNISAAETELSQVKQAMADNERFEAEVKETARAYREILRYFPVEFSQPDFMILLGEEIIAAGGTPVHVKPLPPQQDSEIYQRYPFDVEMEGDYPTVIKWLSSLTKLSQVTSVKSMKLSAISADTNRPMLRFQGIISAYRYIGNLGLKTDESQGGTE